MKKSMYSLMLMDEVVRMVDSLAHIKGMSRSSLINEILAERLQVSTADQQRDCVYHWLHMELEKTPHLEIHFPETGSLLNVTGPMAYSYHPTVRYTVDLSMGCPLGGELRVVTRSKSPELLVKLGDFFTLWKKLENNFVENAVAIQESGRLKRSLRISDADRPQPELLGQSLGGYIQMLDYSLNAFLREEPIEKTVNEITQLYQNYMDNHALNI